mgnify:CR=1 FL=1
MKSERSYPIYKVNKKAEASLVGGHPWVYENDILEFPETEPENGTLADVVSPKGAYLGTGFVSLKSKIRVRLISRNANDTFDASFWRRRVEYAWAYRKTVLEPADLSACRVIFGEADQFPGLTVDRFNNILVTQTLSVGMEKLKPVLFPLLAEVLRADGQTIDGIYERNDEALRAKEGLEQSKGWFELPGENYPASTQTEICENGVYYHVDFENGQKTGFFVDQRENRHLLERYSRGRSVLNMFCYTGGFSFYAMRGGAKQVHSVDSSAKAIDLTNKNVELNFPGDTRHAAFAEDAFKYLDRMGDQYDLIILDPPAFAKHKDALRNALQGYRKLNAKAFEKIKPGGILFTFSCSQVVSKDNFRTAVFTAAAMSGRSVRILHQLTQPADHPVNIYHPEGEYLKGLVLYVE